MVWGIGKKEVMKMRKESGGKGKEEKSEKGEWKLPPLRTYPVLVLYFYRQFKIMSHCFVFVHFDK